MAERNLNIPSKYTAELGTRVVTAGADKDGLTPRECKNLGISEICGELQIASDFTQSSPNRWSSNAFLAHDKLPKTFLNEVFGTDQNKALNARVKWFANQVLSPKDLPIQKRLKIVGTLMALQEDALAAKPQLIKILGNPKENLELRLMAYEMLLFFPLDTADYKILAGIILNPNDNVRLRGWVMKAIGFQRTISWVMGNVQINHERIYNQVGVEETSLRQVNDPVAFEALAEALNFHDKSIFGRTLSENAENILRNLGRKDPDRTLIKGALQRTVHHNPRNEGARCLLDEFEF